MFEACRYCRGLGGEIEDRLTGEGVICEACDGSGMLGDSSEELDRCGIDCRIVHAKDGL